MSNNAARQFAGLLLQAQGNGRKLSTHQGPVNMATTKMGKSRRESIMVFVGSYQAEHGYPPSIRDIGDAVGLSSSSTVWSHLKWLERDGRIVRDPSKPRCIELTSPKPSEADRLRAIFERLRAEMNNREKPLATDRAKVCTALMDMANLLTFAIVEAIGE